jgi:hypothetical protein
MLLKTQSALLLSIYVQTCDQYLQHNTLFITVTALHLHPTSNSQQFQLTPLPLLFATSVWKLRTTSLPSKISMKSVGMERVELWIWTSLQCNFTLNCMSINNYWKVCIQYTMWVQILPPCQLVSVLVSSHRPGPALRSAVPHRHALVWSPHL